MGAEWQAGAFDARCTGDVLIPIAGWIKGPFGLDFRAFVGGYELGLGGYEFPKRGWCITHTPTGYAIQNVVGDLEEAKAVADRLTAFGDWSEVTQVTAPKLFGEQMRALRNSLGDANGTSLSMVCPA